MRCTRDQSSGVRRHAEILVGKLTMGGKRRTEYPHSCSFYKKALPVLTMYGETLMEEREKDPEASW
jgi:hypothetical protein